MTSQSTTTGDNQKVSAYRADTKPEAGVQIVTKRAEALRNPDGTPTSAGWLAIGKRLRESMPSRQFKGKGGRTFDYITARQVAQRLDSTVGPGNWSTDVRVVNAGHPVSVLVGVSIFGVWKWDAGYSNNPDADDPEDRGYEDEPLKAAVSDGLKRAAVQWGVGRFLYGDT